MLRYLLLLSVSLIYGCDVGNRDLRDKEETSGGQPGPTKNVGGGQRPVPPLQCTSELSHRGFISKWQVSAGERVVLPLPETDEQGTEFRYGFAIDWGDGSKAEGGIELPFVESYDDVDREHVYAEAGSYTVSIYGMVEAWSFKQIPTSKNNLVAVTELGDVGWKSLNGAFNDCQNLQTVQGGDTGKVYDMSGMFAGASSVQPNVLSWNFAKVENMDGMFTGVTLPSETYDQLLERIVQTTTQGDVQLDAGNSRFTRANDRQRLERSGWQIEDGGPALALH